MARRDGKQTVFGQFFTGAGFLIRGFATWRTAPGLMLLGMVPALIVAALFAVGLFALGINLETLASAASPFANDWDEPFKTGIRVIIGLALLVVAFLLVVFAFTTLTLIIGAPFYERIWRHMESRNGELPDDGVHGFWRTLGKGIGDGLRTLIPAVLMGLPLLLLGLIPVVGQVLVPIVGAVVGGWFLTVELSAMPFDARGRSLSQRRATLRSRLPMSLGFGVATYLVFLVPLGAVLVMPAAVAGAALLARRELGEDAAAASA